MKVSLINLLVAALTVVAAIYLIFRRLYLSASKKVLKRYFGIETPIYRKWHDRRARKLQLALDSQHKTNSL